ncbi:DUF4238 domain-containing protein [Actinomadura sp. GTD37]|uniref:DUF4238 domain-containing protein n=1 Tax=Actinomadura sp. GTD37 TaxID=1778030 RepID=UPI0035C0A7E5
MNTPKLHHYVPQFYLRRFMDHTKRLWVWDRDINRVFRAQPKVVAAETYFYYLSESAEQGHDPLTMEKQFSGIESDMARATNNWLMQIANAKAMESISLQEGDRETGALFLALQFLRTEDSRSIIEAIHRADKDVNSEVDARSMHTAVLWDERIVQRLTERIAESAWIFATNITGTPFKTSDNPIAFRTQDHRQWIKAGIYGDGVYLTYPLSPNVIMYCYPNEGHWRESNLMQLDCRLSPVRFTEDMARNENAAQTFTASRFIISSVDDFTWEREFAKTIGTDVYAPRER